MKLVRQLNEQASELELDLVNARHAAQRLIESVRKAEKQDTDYKFALEYSQLVKEAQALVETIDHTLQQ